MGEKRNGEDGLRQLFEQAALSHSSGDLLASERMYGKILALYPDNFEALRGLCRLKLQVRQLEMASDLARRILLINKNAGVGHRLLGEIQMASGRPLDALESFEKALSITRDDAELHFFRGVILRGLGRNEEALQAYGRTLELVPGKAEVLCNYGNVLHDLGRYDEAISCFEQALQSAPKVSVLHYNRGNSLLSSGRYGEALESFDEALKLDPGNPGAWSNRSNALRIAGRAEDALFSADRALALVPNLADALVSRGNALLDLNRPREAIEAFERAVKALPNSGVAYNGLGRSLQRLGLVHEATLQFQRAIAVEPNFQGAIYNLALTKLQQRDFSGVWLGFEARLDDGGYRCGLRKCTESVELFERMARWRGPEDQNFCTVSIWSEQGLGDQILFSTLLPELIATGFHFVYEVDARLIPAYRRNFPGVNFVAIADPPSVELIQSDKALFVGSLPKFFRNNLDSFSRQPQNLLSAAPDRVAHYMKILGLDPKVAISWRSTRESRIGQEKSASLADFVPLLRVPGVQFVDIQYGDTAAEREAVLKNLGLHIKHVEGVDFYNDLDEVLAIIEACDLLITTSNANAHLAAALGKPVWLLYPSERAPFHYWAHGGDHRCLWYPSVEIISGLELTDWPKLVAVAAERLRQVVGRAV